MNDNLGDTVCNTPKCGFDALHAGKSETCIKKFLILDIVQGLYTVKEYGTHAAATMNCYLFDILCSEEDTSEVQRIMELFSV